MQITLLTKEGQNDSSRLFNIIKTRIDPQHDMLLIDARSKSYLEEQIANILHIGTLTVPWATQLADMIIVVYEDDYEIYPVYEPGKEILEEAEKYVSRIQ